MASDYTIKVRLNVLSRTQILVLSGAFIGIFLLFIAIAFLTPTMMDSNSVTVYNCYSGSMCFELENGNAMWMGDLNSIDLENQVIVLRVIPESSEKLVFSSDLSLSVVGVDSETDTEGDEVGTSVEDCKVECDSKSCDEFILFYEPIIEYSYYNLKLTFLDRIPEEITSMKFELSFIKHDFTVYQLAIKYSFLFLSIVSLVVYLFSLRALPFGNWRLESKLVAVLSGSLVLFNEPLFAVNVYWPSEAIFVISVICISQFIFTVLGFWVILLQESTNLPRKAWFYLAEVVVLAGLFVVMVIAYAYIHLHYRHEPNYDWIEDFNSNYKVLYIAFAAIGGFVAIMLLALLILSFPKVCKLSKRYKVISGMNIAVGVLTFVGLGVGAIQSNPKNGTFLLICIGVYNFYVFALAILYAPKRIPVVEFQVVKETKRKTDATPKEKEDPEIIEEEGAQYTS